jgi:protein TonB
MSRSGPNPAPGLFPRSLLASASVHALLLTAGVVWGVLARGGERPGPRVYALRFDEPRPEPLVAAEEPLAEEPRASEHEPELRESEVWDELLETAEVTAEPAPPLRAVDWLDERPLEVASLPPRPEPEPEPERIREPDATPPPAAPRSASADVAPQRPAVEPEPFHNPPPAYPRLARRAGEEGSVLCRLHVGADGSVARVEIVESSGHARLDAAAREALVLWRYRPRLEGGRAVATSLVHRVTFRLAG